MDNATTTDLWDNAGPFLYRIMPEDNLDAFFGEERDIIQITFSMGKWWLAETGEVGEDHYRTMKEAKAAGDRRVEEAEKGQDALLLAKAGLDPAVWTVRYEGALTFVDQAGDRAIVADPDRRQGEQSWDAFQGDDLVAEGADNVATALAAFSPKRDMAA